MTASAGMSGFAPTLKIEPANLEQGKYRRIWQNPEYRAVAPGESFVLPFLAQASPERDAEVIDFGCGTGRAGLLLAALGKVRVTLVDFAPNCLDVEVEEACKAQPDRIKFMVWDLTKTLPINAAYGFCTDVLEHVPTADVPQVLRNILASAQHVFFNISLIDDVMGPALMGAPLHLTVQPATWWLEQLRKSGAVVHWSDGNAVALSVYCSVWRDAKDVVKIGKINTDESVVDAQVAANIAAGWAHVMPHERQAREVILLAGGPSMNDEIEKIRALRADGAALVTVNGAYAWALERGLEPSVQIVLDAREFNARFTRPVTSYTKYLIASQVHPSTLEGLPKDRTLLWHSGLSDENIKRVEAATGYYWPIPGGSTVVLRALPLLRLLGLSRIHLFGFDSCVQDNGSHHAYVQAENDREILLPVAMGGKVFQCAPWMVSQATEFRDLVGFLGDEIECAVYGDGLIATMLKTGAELSTEGV